MAVEQLVAEVREAGNRLENPPSSVEELLLILNQLESVLTKVEQSPSESMQNALKPSKKALASEEIREHSNEDVKVAAASCLSEVTRITAPEAPFEDDEMKELFQLIVAAFEKLHDTSSRSYLRRVSILETVAKVRSCVVMLDLDCDALILKMFQHFLKSIRDLHEDTVYSSMETIMTLVLEESEDIQPELLSVLLDTLKKENQHILPIARRLAEKVLRNCAVKLKPYLMQAMESMGFTLDDYTEIVAVICQEPDSVKHNDSNISGEHLADENKLSVKAGSDNLPQVAKELEPQSTCTHENYTTGKKSPKSIMSNGNAETVNDDALVSVDSPKVKQEISEPVTQPAEGETASLGTELVKSETESDQPAKKKRGRKPNSLKQTAGASGHFHADSEKETLGKVVNSSFTEDQSATGTTMPPGNEKESLLQVSSPTVSRDQSVKASLSPSQRTPDGTRPKRGRPPRAKKENMDEDTDSGLRSVVKVAASNEQIEAGEPKSADVHPKKEHSGNSEMEVRLNQPSSKKAIYGLASPHTNVAKSDFGATSESEAKPQKRLGKKMDARESDENEASGKKEGGKTKRERGKATSEQDESADTIIKKKSSSLKSVSKSIDKSQSHSEKTPKTGSKRKRTSRKEKEYLIEGWTDIIVGKRIKVWWPKDKMFYEGVIDSYDPVKRKHKILYNDGDEEELVLNEERWEFIVKFDGMQATDLPSPDASEMYRKKKVKTSSDSPAKQTKTDTKGKGASSSKSRGDTSAKSGGKSMDDSKAGTKTTEDTPKTATKSKGDSTGKSKDHTSKSSSKSKDDSPKTGVKSKEGARSKDVDTPKTGTKSKDDKTKFGSSSKSGTPKTGSKPRDNGTNSKGKSSLSKVQESEDSKKGSTKGRRIESEVPTKGKVLDSGDSKSGKKRRKVTG